MDQTTRQLIDRLDADRSLPLEGYEYLVSHYSPMAAKRLEQLAVVRRKAVYGNSVFIRGLIEVSSFCRNDCYYCGLRRSNEACERYRLSDDEIFDRVGAGYAIGFRTFVLQGGEDMRFSRDRVASIVSSIKERHPDCAVTLSLGERDRDTYAAWRDAGADRYLLRHEAADLAYYETLHPSNMSGETRLACLQDLRDVGYATGAGFMVGAPGQTSAHVAADLKFIEEFKPEMCGLGPFIPHHSTRYAHDAAGTVEQTCFLLSIVRLILPTVLLPATTALGSIDPRGRERGILAGANVVMPNLSPSDVREKYAIYDNKAHTGVESAEGLEDLNSRMGEIGYRIVVDRGDPATEDPINDAGETKGAIVAGDPVAAV